MSKKRSKRNTKEALKKLKAKRARVKYSTGGYRSGQSLGYTPPSGRALEEISVSAKRRGFFPQGVDGDLGDAGFAQDFQGMDIGTAGYNPSGLDIPAPTGFGSGQDGTSSSDGYGGRDRSPQEPEEEERDYDNTAEIFGLDTEDESTGDEAEATNDGTLEGGGDGGGGAEEPPPPVVEPVDEEPTTGGTDLTGTGLDVDIPEPKTKFVNEDGTPFDPEAGSEEVPSSTTQTGVDTSVSTTGQQQTLASQKRLEPSDLEGMTFDERNSKLKEYGIKEQPLPESMKTYGEQYVTDSGKPPIYYGTADQPDEPTVGDIVIDFAKGVVIDVVTGATLGVLAAKHFGLPVNEVMKMFGKAAFGESVPTRLTGILLDQSEKIPYIGPVIEGVRDIPGTVGDFLSDSFMSGSETVFPDTGAGTFGYDPTGGISVGTGAGTVSGSGGTATSGTTTATGITETTNPIDVPENEGDRGTASDEETDEIQDSTDSSTVFDNSDLGTILNNLNLGGNNGDNGMAIERDEKGVPITSTTDTTTAGIPQGEQPSETSTAPPTQDIAMVDKTLTTQEDDIEELAPLPEVTAPTVAADTLSPVAPAEATTVSEAAPVQAQTVQTVTTEQLRQQKAAQAFDQTPEVIQFKADSEAHMADPERIKLMEAFNQAAESGDKNAQTQAEAALKAFDATMTERGQALSRQQQEFMSTYGEPTAATGQITEESTAVATDATLSERAVAAARDTAAEQAALSKEVGFDVSTKSMVEPVTGEKIQVAATPAAEAAQREAITDDTFTPMEAAQIIETVGYEAVQNRPVKGEAAQGAAVEMLAEVADMPPAIAEAIVEDPAKVEAQLDNQPVEVKAAIAALPTEALMSSQMENLLGSLEENKVPVWARPAVDATNAMLAQRGLSASTIGRDSLFNAIIQSALPIAENNANALQQRAAQNLSNEQQANITTATLDMERRMNNLANQQTAASQTAQMSNDMKKLQSSFKQEAVITTAQQEQQIRLQNLENRQRTAEQNNRNQQETMALNLGNQQQMELANLEIEAQVNRDNMSAENQRRLAEMNVAAEFLSKNAELKNSMDIANMSTEAQMKLANLQALNQASADNLTAQQQTELANMEADLKTKLTQADIASSMGLAQLNADQQRAVVNAQTVANIDLAKFDAKQQAELVNSKFMQTMTLENFNAENTAILQNATAMASMDLANADNRTKISVTNAQNFLQMDLANLANEQQALILKSQQDQQSLLSDAAAANATAQFNAESTMQTDQFMATLAAQIDQYNASSIDTMSKFNIEQQNRVNAENAGNQLKADMANATLAAEAEQFNLNMQNQRDQWNVANRQTIQQADLTWRRNANLADTAAINDANRQNVANAFAMSQQQQAQFWQEQRDEASWANNNYENNQTRIVQIATAAMAADTSYAASGVQPTMTLAETLAIVGLGQD